MVVAIGVDVGSEVVVRLPRIMGVECCCCGSHFGFKDGQGSEGVTSTICTPCVEEHYPTLADEFKRRRADSGAAAWGMAPDHREPLNAREVVFREV